MRIAAMNSLGVYTISSHSGLAQSITTFITRNSLATIRAASDGGIIYWTQNPVQRQPRREENADWREREKRYTELETSQNIDERGRL